VTGHGSSRLTRGGSLKRDAPGVAGQGGEVRGHHRSEAHQRVATGDREMGRGALATSTGACGDHGTGVHASPAVRGAREGPIRVGVWRGRRCRAWLREGRRDGVGRKLELELESAMAARRLCSAQNEEESEQRQGRTLGSWRGEPRALTSATVGIGRNHAAKRRTRGSKEKCMAATFGTPVALEDFPRTGGGRSLRHPGGRFWAGYGPNWILGPK
jgi:hypothetical protein